MLSLIPCPSCHRYVESSAAACPFCELALVPVQAASICQRRCAGHTSPRLGRAAMMAVGAALLCAACARSGVVPYGAVIFPDAGTETVDAGAEMDDASDAGGDGDK